MRVLFLGSTKRGFLVLKSLASSGADIVGVISFSQHAHETARYEEEIRRLASSRGLPVYETKNLKERDYAEIISRLLKPDIAFVVGCRIMIPEKIYRIPPMGTLAVHDSLLPEYRGSAPTNWAIINGKTSTGVTLFYLSETMDAGDIIAQKKVPIGTNDTADAVYDRVCSATVDIILKALPLLSAGKAPRKTQNSLSATYVCARNPEDGLIDWSRPARDIYNLIRGLAYPYPGAYTHQNLRKLWIWKAALPKNPAEFAGRIPGRVVAVSSADGFIDVLAGDGVVRVLEVQPEGGERMPAAAAVKSIRAKFGLSLDELSARLRALED